MAAIDKIYVNSMEEYKLFRAWCEQQPPILDKYGTKCKLTDYMFTWTDRDDTDGRDFPVMNAPCYIDAYIIRNCPYDFIQKSLMLNYGYETDEEIKEVYEEYILNRSEEDQALIDETNGEYPQKPIPYWWLSKDDFIVEGDKVSLKNRKKSSYEMILDNEIYTSPIDHDDFIPGKHVRIVSVTIDGKTNRPYRTKKHKVKRWNVDFKSPDGSAEIWNHEHKYGKYAKHKYGTFDFGDDFVRYEWATTGLVTWPKTIKSLIRILRKAGLPVGTIVTAKGRFVGDEYVFEITK